MATIGSVASLHRFPVKSMQGESVAEVEVDADGIVGDRTWALRDDETKKLVSAKRPRLWRAALDCQATGTGSDVVVALPSGDRHAIGDPALAEALAELFGRAVTVEEAVEPQQGVYESDWPEIEGITLAGEIDLPTNLTGEGRSFVDVGVLHLLTTASIATLAAERGDTAADLRRFRPGIVIDTPDLSGFPEDGWIGDRLRIGSVEITVGEPTPRCVMTTVEQGSLPADRSVLTTLAEHHRVETPLGTFACLGSYASVVTPGRIEVGDPVEVI